MDTGAIESLYLLMPKQPNKYNNIHYNFKYVQMGLREAGIESKILELSQDGSSNIPTNYGADVKQLRYQDLNEFLSKEIYFVGLDEFDFIRQISISDPNRKVPIWVHYFNGASLFFRQYIDWPDLSRTKKTIKSLYRGLVPGYVQRRLIGSYTGGLKGRHLMAQSLWTSLLLNRIYNFPCSGIVYNPLFEGEFVEECLRTERDKIVVYLGGKFDTHLKDIVPLLVGLERDIAKFEIHSFGNEQQSIELGQGLGRRVVFHKGISREDLFKLYSEAVFTVTPVFNGNFEMVPIESLMSYAPVISYLQPFIEVTGKTDLVANIQNPNESARLVRKWISSDMTNSLEKMRSNIFEKMNYNKVAADLAENVISQIKK